MSQAIKVGIFGSAGRMGQEVKSIVDEDHATQVAALVDRAGQEDVACLDDIKTGQIDVLIDFTVAAAFSEVVQWCASQGCPLVSGTTGLTTEQLRRLETAAKKVPCFWAPNMSIGIALMNKMIMDLCKLPDADFQIEEHHHRFKKDRPSGTALFLQETLANEVGGRAAEPLVARGGGVFGVHKAYAFALEETLMIEHVALNRKVFARGAVRAAKWLVDQPAGLYHMADLVKDLRTSDESVDQGT